MSSSSHDKKQGAFGRATSRVGEGFDTTNLEDLQTEEQRRILDAIAQVRKCGVDSILSLPQLVVCGDQSAGKSSVLEALTEIPFPRNDNLCTRFATEIILRQSAANSLNVRVIPDPRRPRMERSVIENFEESIQDFNDLPRVMESAKKVMGIYDNAAHGASQRTFASDVLSIEIEGPAQPQLTLVDIPGLVQFSTEGVSDEDVALVNGITDHYISQPRTICLAVVTATNDAANQSILRRVRDVDPNGGRTLGIITKPDRLPSGSGSEAKFLELARNEDVFFGLGWHVVKNQTFEESKSAFVERNVSEAHYFRTSNFNKLPKENVGIRSLKSRLSLLLFEQVKHELPKLRGDVELALDEAKAQLRLLGDRRSTATECRAYLAQLSLDFWEACKAAISGNYEGDYFGAEYGHEFALDSPHTIARLRAVVQYMNTEFENTMCTRGHKYQFGSYDSNDDGDDSRDDSDDGIYLDLSDAIKWVRQALIRTRGRELVGNFNPLVVGELFWEQSSHWRELAEEHIERIARVCENFLNNLLEAKCPKDVRERTWSSQIIDKLKARRAKAFHELDQIMQDAKSFPINYNHYYTDIITNRRRGRRETMTCRYNSMSIHPDMDDFFCEQTLDCLIAIYKVQRKIFVANVSVQVIERHIIRGLEGIFSPVVVNSLSDAEVEAISSEPGSSRREREFLEDRIIKLKAGHEVLRGVMGSYSK